MGTFVEVFHLEIKSKICSEKFCISCLVVEQSHVHWRKQKWFTDEILCVGGLMDFVRCSSSTIFRFRSMNHQRKWLSSFRWPKKLELWLVLCMCLRFECFFFYFDLFQSDLFSQTKFEWENRFEFERITACELTDFLLESMVNFAFLNFVRSFVETWHQFVAYRVSIIASK